MQKILEKVKGKVDSAEVFYIRSHRVEVGYEGWKLKKTGVLQTEGYSLRVIKNGKIGFSATTDPNGIDEMIENAVMTSPFGEAVDIEFPSKVKYPEMDIYDKKLEQLPLSTIIDYGHEFIELCEKYRPIAELGFECQRVITEVRIANTKGLEGGYEKTYLSWGCSLNRVKEGDVFMLWDGSATTYLPDMSAELSKMMAPFDEKLALAENVVDVKTGKMPIVFDPRGAIVLLIPLRAGINGRTVYTKTSPLVGKEGEKLFDEKLTIVDDGTLARRIASSPFDDEGLPKTRIPIVEKGVFKNFIFDLVTAAKAGRKSNGCGERGIFSPPVPSQSNVAIEPGNRSKEEIIGDIEEGVLIESVLGLGQGNVISGTFSNPFGTAYKIEKGKLVGRVKDATVSGNIYRDLAEIQAIGDKQELIYGAFLTPHIRVDTLTVTGK